MADYEWTEQKKNSLINFSRNVGPWNVELHPSGVKIELDMGNSTKYIEEFEKPIRVFISELYVFISNFYCPLDKLQNLLYYKNLESVFYEEVASFLQEREKVIIMNNGRKIEDEFCYRLGVFYPEEPFNKIQV